jgi:hypothetical protein
MRTPLLVHEAQASSPGVASPASGGEVHWQVGTITISSFGPQSGMSVGWSSWGILSVLGDCMDVPPKGPLQRCCNWMQSCDLGWVLQCA